MGAALLAVACNSTPLNAGSGELTSPTGAAATGAGDRDLVFIANTGRDGLRALQLCNHALLSNGSKAPGDTCPEGENAQFIPSPIRVFPAAIDTGEHPLRVAGARLQRADGSGAGVALAVGVNNQVAVVDARSLLDAQQNPGTSPQPIQQLDVGDLTIDVVAANPVDIGTLVEKPADPGGTVTAFVATRSELLVLDVGLGANGFARLPTIRGRCTLAPVVPTKLAVVPGSDASIYVADGAGDGVVSVATASIGPSGGACTMDRISAGGRSVRSIALSPPWFETLLDSNNNPVPTSHVAGELLLMVLEPLSTIQPGMDLDPGGLLIARTGIPSGPKGIVPIPPFGLSDTQEPMQPLALPRSGFLREAAFLRAVPPLKAGAAPSAPDYTTCSFAPCTPLYVGQPTNAPVHVYSLLAAVTATDGATYFIEVPARRFVNLNLFLQTLNPVLTQAPSLSPSSATPPVLSIAGCTVTPSVACDPSAFQPGLTRTNSWRAVFHAPLPGFGVRGGTLTHSASGTLLVSLPSTDLGVWRNDPTLRLNVGDVVSFGSYSLSPQASATDDPAACPAVVSSETAFRFELPILSFPDASTIEVAELADAPDGSTRGFHATGCSALGVTAELRTDGAQPWLVFEGETAKGRVQPDGSFVAVQRRFDYPLPAYDPANPPIAANNVSFRFTIIPGTVTPKALFTWAIDSGQAPISFLDNFITAGFATAVLPYSSPRQPSLIYSSVTGSNEVLQANPAVLSSQTGGIIAFK
jgi:hypothetical protein